MRKLTIPWCGKTEYNPYARDCHTCQYGDKDDEYCSYWDIHSPNECPDCRGSGYSCGGQCDRCNGTGEI